MLAEYLLKNFIQGGFGHGEGLVLRHQPPLLPVVDPGVKRRPLGEEVVHLSVVFKEYQAEIPLPGDREAQAAQKTRLVGGVQRVHPGLQLLGVAVQLLADKGQVLRRLSSGEGGHLQVVAQLVVVLQAHGEGKGLGRLLGRLHVFLLARGQAKQAKQQKQRKQGGCARRFGHGRLLSFAVESR